METQQGTTIGNLQEITSIPDNSFILITKKGVSNYRISPQNLLSGLVTKDDVETMILNAFQSFGATIDEINGDETTDPAINNLTEIKRFLQGFNDNTTLSGVLNDFKQEILNDIELKFFRNHTITN